MGISQVIYGNTTIMDISSDTVTNASLLSGYTAHGSDGEVITGAMTNQGAVTSTLNCGETYTIPEGYHNGSGIVTANSLASQTVGTASAEYIMNGYTAWVNGSQVTGNAGAYVVNTTLYIPSAMGSVSGTTLSL